MAKFLQLEITSVCTDIMSFLTYQLGTTLEYFHIPGWSWYWINTKEHLLQKIDEENRPHAGLAQEIGFGSAYLCSLPWLVKGALHLQKKRV